jgi:Flp pilus assembly protein TadG
LIALTSKGTRQARRGSVMLYMSFALVVICGFVSLAVDYGRVQVARSELQTAADIAARYAATGIKHEINGINASAAMAQAALAENKVDARLIKQSQFTVETGVWNPDVSKFVPHTQVDKINAVRVTLKCQPGDGSAVPTSFASVLGFSQASITVTSTALYDSDDLYTTSTGTGTRYVQKYVPATSNLWLAGMPAGTIASNPNPHNNPDYAGTTTTPRQTPVAMAGLRVTPGSTLTFDGVNGGANNEKSATLYDGDGNTGQIVNNLTGGEHSKSDIRAPINSVVAVFLNDNVPTGTSPTTLDFSTDTSRDFAALKPQLNQTFFIGDGRRDNGDLQQFVIPPGATRLFIGTMDSYEWNNNVGGFTVTATAATKVVLVD